MNKTQLLNKKQLLLGLLGMSAFLASGVASAAIDTAGVQSAFTDAGIAIAAIGGMVLIAAGVVVGVRYAKHAVFG